MKKTWLLGGALTGAVLAAALGYSTRARSADHIDAPAVTAAPTADITDVYSWMDGTNQVLVMNLGGVSAPTTFSTTTQYVFHTNSTSAYGTAGTTPVNVIATFASNTSIQLWVGTSEYVTGDPSSPTGLSSADGKVKVFAGPRADSFFFNLDGFHHAEAIVEGVAAADAATPLTFANDAGCPALSVGQGQALTEALSTETDGGPAPNNFAANNVLSIVVSVDATLLNAGGPITSVWASTNGS